MGLPKGSLFTCFIHENGKELQFQNCGDGLYTFVNPINNKVFNNKEQYKEKEKNNIKKEKNITTEKEKELTINETNSTIKEDRKITTKNNNTQ